MSEKYLGEVSTPLLINQIKENCAQKRTTLPIPSIDELGNTYQYMGTTSGSLVHGYSYECVSDGQDPATYSWSQVNTQPTAPTPTAATTTFDNTTSGLQATNVQGAIDEVVDGLGTAASKDFTPNVAPNNHNLVESNAVYNAITTALTSIYTPRGDLTCAELTSSLLVAANVGNIYEMSDAGTTSALFLQGAGKTIHVGDNVGIIQTGVDTYKFNLMANAFDMTDYQKKELTSAVEGQTTVEGALGALSTNKVSKVSNATNGDIATLDANGDLVDSGISKNGFVRTGVINTSTGDSYKKVEITTSDAYLNGRFYLKDRRGNEYVIMIASGYPTAFYRLARVSAVREYIVEIRQTRGHNGRLNVFIHSLDFDAIGYTFIGCDNVTVTVSDSDATEFATGTAITWQKFTTDSDIVDKVSTLSRLTSFGKSSGDIYTFLDKCVEIGILKKDTQMSFVLNNLYDQNFGWTFTDLNNFQALRCTIKFNGYYHASTSDNTSNTFSLEIISWANHVIYFYFEDRPNYNGPHAWRTVSTNPYYSTSEAFTGQYWIDGKPIYRKTYTGLSLQSPATNVWNSFGIAPPANAGLLIKSMIIRNDKVACEGIALKLDTQNNDIVYINPTFNASTNNVTLTIEYTKTTD